MRGIWGVMGGEGEGRGERRRGVVMGEEGGMMNTRRDIEEEELGRYMRYDFSGR